MATPAVKVQEPPSKALYRQDGPKATGDVFRSASLHRKSRLSLVVGDCVSCGSVRRTRRDGYRWDCGIAEPSAKAGWVPQAGMTPADRTGELLGRIASTTPEWLRTAPEVIRASATPIRRGWSALPFDNELSIGHLG